MEQTHQIALISLGTELTQGFTLNTNAHWMAGRLCKMGFNVACEITLPDSAESWRSAWKMLRNAGIQTVILSGGLGPTEDDKTRFFIAETFHQPLEFHEEWLQSIKTFVESRNKNFSEANRIQAFFPRGATVLNNPVGSAPGFRITQDGVTLFALPGVPFEAKEMFERHVVPYLSPKQKNFFFRELRLAGIFESDLTEKWKEFPFPAQVFWSSLPVRDGLLFRLYSTESAQILEETAQRLIQRLDDRQSVISTNGKTLLEVVADLLSARGETLSTAESCSGGMIASEIVNLPGASVFFKGGACAYWNEAKENILGVPAETLSTHGAVSKETAIAMADGARRIYHSDWAISTTGIAGPGGGTAEKPVGLVWMAVASPWENFAFCEKFSGDREQIREKSVFKVLDVLRRAILKKNEQKSTCTKEQ